MRCAREGPIAKADLGESAVRHGSIVGRARDHVNTEERRRVLWRQRRGGTILGQRSLVVLLSKEDVAAVEGCFRGRPEERMRLLLDASAVCRTTQWHLRRFVSGGAGDGDQRNEQRTRPYARQPAMSLDPLTRL